MNLKILETFLSWLISPGNLTLFGVCLAGYFLPELWQKILILFIAAVYLKFYPGFDLSLCLFLASAGFGLWLGFYLKTRTALAIIITLTAPFVLLYLLFKITA